MTATSYALVHFFPTASCLQCQTTRSTQFHPPLAPRPVPSHGGSSFTVGWLPKAWIRWPLSWCPAASHRRRQRGVHHSLRIVRGIGRGNDHARRPSDRIVSGSHTADDIEPWMENARAKYKVKNTKNKIFASSRVLYLRAQ